MLFPNIRLFAAVLLAALTVVATSSTENVRAKSRTTRTNSARTVRVDGASVEFKTKRVKKGAEESDELEAILTAVATLRVEKTFGYGRSSLPGGSYSVTVEQSDEKKWYFVVGEKPPEKPRRGRRKNGSKRTDERNGADAMGIAGTRRSAPSSTRDDEDPEKPEKEDPRPPKQALWLRARIRFSKTAEPKPEVVFELRSLQRGGRFELSVRAGSTLGRASFRVIDTAEKKDA